MAQKPVPPPMQVVQKGIPIWIGILFLTSFAFMLASILVAKALGNL